MNVVLSRYEIRQAIQMYVEAKTGLKVTSFPTLIEASQSTATYAEVQVAEKKK